MQIAIITVIFLVSLLWFAGTDAIGGESAFTLGYGFSLANGSGLEGLEMDFIMISCSCPTSTRDRS